MPSQHPGRSEQDVETPEDLIDAIENRFEPMGIDLAANPSNAKAPNYLTEQDDSLGTHWAEKYPHERMWLNPPFAKLGVWTRKCREEGELLRAVKTKGNAKSRNIGSIFLLIPAAVGSNWFADHVFGHARILALRPRVTFVGHTAPYPKDLLLCIYGAAYKPGFELWKWK